MMKKIIACSLAIVMVLTTSLFATNMNDASQGIPDWEGIYYDPQLKCYVSDFYIVEDGMLKAISFGEYLKYSTVDNTRSFASNGVSNLSANASSGSFVSFTTQNYDLVCNRNNYKTVTPKVSGPASISTGETITITDSYSVTVSAGVQASLFDTISANSSLSTSFDCSASTASTFSVAFDVPAGRIARVCFAPQILKISGVLTTTSGTSNLTASYPTLTDSGFADGLYFLMYG